MDSSIDALVSDPDVTLGALRRFTRDNGGRTRLLWTHDFGAVKRHEAVVLCATDEADVRRILELARILWGDSFNSGLLAKEAPPPRGAVEF